MPILLLFALAACQASAPATGDRSDSSIKARVETAVRGQNEIEARYIAIDVAAGVVTVSGLVPTVDQRKSVTRLVEKIPGVVDVVNNLAIQE